VNGNGQKTPATLGGSGGPEGNDGTLDSPTIPHLVERVNPQAIPTASGGPIHFAICDALFTLKAELEALGLDCPHDVIAAAWFKVLTEASYIPEQERVAVLREAKTSWPA